jgi:uncharacterized OB-fold protein
VSEPERPPKRPRSAETIEAARPAEPAPVPPARPRSEPTTPLLLDFYSLQEAKQTRVSRFFDALREGRLTTTRCPKDGVLLWPPRAICPTCHSEELEWTDLPGSGRLYAFSAVLMGAPLGMEADVPFVVGLVDLDGVALRIFGRIVGAPWDACHVGERVEFEPFDLADGRVFYRFRVASGAVPAARG